MRCPQCSHEQKYQEGMKCGQCGYRFVFDPKTDKLRDNIISQMIQQLSDNGHYYFTQTQLAMEICRYWRKQKVGLITFAFIVFIIWAIISAILDLNIFIAVAILCPVLFFTIKAGIKYQTRIPFNEAQAGIQRYHKIYPIKQLVNGKAFVKTPGNPIQSKLKISSLDFSLDNKAITLEEELFLAPERILIVERDDMVDMLIRNRFHLETKTLVVSQSGYPTAAFEACPGFINNNPNMPVQVLHDASVKSFGLIQKIRGGVKWQFARNNLVDLGFSRQNLAQKSELRPWLPGANSDKVIFSKDFHKMLRDGRRFPIDSLSPKPLFSLLTAAVVGGMLTLAVTETMIGISQETSYG